MRILASQDITITAIKRKVDKPFTLVQCECRMLEYEHLFRHHPGADSTRTQVRPEQHTLISVFKLNSCKLCQFKHLRARARELTRAVRRFVRVLIRSAQTSRASVRAQILSSLSEVLCLNGQIHTKNMSKCRLGKYLIADSNNKEITHCSWLNRFFNFNKD